ncbi:MAG TPA: SAM-dependent methyltransferase [Acidimicrobiia bacterium]|nr:SAM-dependent methyltransferase [Acidimicrobiia bacterium]
MADLAERIAERIRREGPIPFDRFVDAALYDEDGGFYAAGGGAGRAGRDFVTSPEVGVLFGALVARFLDRAWDELSRADPFVVVDAGAGRGRLAADVLRADPACSRALRYVLVERSAALRAAQRELLTFEPADRAFGPAVREEPDEAPTPVEGIGPIVTSLPELPAIELPAGVVIANELLDNLPFGIVERVRDRWTEVRVGLGDDGFVEVAVPASPEIAAAADDVAAGATIPAGARLPVPMAIVDWIDACGHVLRRGFLVVIDYADAAASLAARPQEKWLRTYRGHQRGGAPLAAPGAQDITATVPAEHLVAHAGRAGFRLVDRTTQAEWLAALGIDELVDDARGLWRERAAVGDLEAIAARSRVSEAAALTDPSGLGAHSVFVFAK